MVETSLVNSSVFLFKHAMVLVPTMKLKYGWFLKPSYLLYKVSVCLRSSGIPISSITGQRSEWSTTDLIRPYLGDLPNDQRRKALVLGGRLWQTQTEVGVNGAGLTSVDALTERWGRKWQKMVGDGEISSPEAVLDRVIQSAKEARYL